jgi:hypothetical protein
MKLQIEEMKMSIQASSPVRSETQEMKEQIKNLSQSIESVEPPKVIHSVTPIPKNDLEEIVMKIKQLEVSLVHSDKME